MDTRSDVRGSTLVEALVAASLLLVLVAGLGSGLLTAHQLMLRAELALAAAAATSSRLAQLQSVPWVDDWGDGMSDPADLALTPADALDRNTGGAYDILDAAGLPLGSPAASTPRVVRRWRVQPAAGDGARVRLIEVCAFPWPAGEGVTPLVCAGTIRTRQP